MAPADCVAYYIEQGMTKKEAIREASRVLGLSRNELYSLLLQNDGDGN